MSQKGMAFKTFFPAFLCVSKRVLFETLFIEKQYINRKKDTKDKNETKKAIKSLHLLAIKTLLNTGFTRSFAEHIKRFSALGDN